MNTTRLAFVLATAAGLLTVPNRAAADTFGSGDNAFEIEFVTIGDPGNAADTTGSPNPAGSVDYVFNIGKYAISRDMVEKASAEGGLGLTLFPMDDFVTGGLRPDMPATGVTWNGAARFTNWLNTSQGFPAAYKFSTQPGEPGYNANVNIELWVAGDAGFDSANPFRNSQAHYFLPSVHEWYKAAFYDPDANGGAGGYWDYPTGSDSVPSSVASGTTAGTAVWDQAFEQGPADITLAGGLSPYGVMGQAGNVWEWNETELDLVNDRVSSVRGLRGSRWNDDDSDNLSAAFRNGAEPWAVGLNIGIRVARAHLVGDHNNNGQLDAGDLDLQAIEMQKPVQEQDLAEYDLNGDSNVDFEDRKLWVEDEGFKNTYIGDANLDGEFNSSDMTQVFAAGKYETGADAGWAEGDWNGDGFFGSRDMVAAFVDGGYEQGPKPTPAAVPEPTSALILVTGLIGAAVYRRRPQP